MNCKFHTAAFLVLTFGLAGCGDANIVPVKGLATRGGQPLRQLRVTFYPEHGAASWADTDEQGHFELVYSKDVKGALKGKHKVTGVFVLRGPQQELDFESGKLILHPEQNLLQEKYGKLETTPLTVEVIAAQTELQLKFE